MKSSVPSFYILSLGCAKNTVDSTSMGALLQQGGYHSTAQAEDADVLIVNTCGFIGPAKEESIRELRQLGDHKRPDQLLVAAGCLSQRYGQELSRWVPELDGVLGTRRWMDIVPVVKNLQSRRADRPLYHLPDVPQIDPDVSGIPRAAIDGASAYLKIADGCRRPCAFCAIPLIKGPAVSRQPEEILQEARQLQDAGIREINLIAQDTTDYGHDLGQRDGLASLLDRLVVEAPEIDWFRLLYAYPGYVTERLIEVMARHTQILPYLDIPLQHADRRILLEMRRPANLEQVYETVAKLREAMPAIALRTTFIVGYPGESEQAFDRLLEFVRAVRFDRVGVFTFSYEPGTVSEKLGDPIPAEVKQERRGRLMEIQQRISLEKNQALVGRTLDVLIEGYTGGVSVGRTYRDAPEIDGVVIVEDHLDVGALAPVRMTGALAYDLTGVRAGG
jgi:ribosomal protein S12 methylthiotransferase